MKVERVYSSIEKQDVLLITGYKEKWPMVFRFPLWTRDKRHCLKHVRLLLKSEQTV